MGRRPWYPVITAKGKSPLADITGDEVADMFTPKGYYTSQGYTGFLPDGSRMAFPTQAEYLDYVEDTREAA